MLHSSGLNILCVTDYYLPGIRAGGLISSISGLRELLRDTAKIFVFTRSRDLGESRPYANVTANRWIETDVGPVFYADDQEFNLKGLKSAISDQNFDAIYLNSFFSPCGSILPLINRKFIPRTALRLPVVLAPRGELSPAALSIKSIKKTLYIAAARATGIYDNVHWQASSDAEARNIIKIFPIAAGRVHIASDAVSWKEAIKTDIHSPRKCAVKIVFISRIAPIKNLDFLLLALIRLNHPITLNIYGPIEDQNYWRSCLKLIASLPTNIVVSYEGTLAPSDIVATFAEHDLFAFPSRGESFGHVIFESLCAGTPVVTSDCTPWKSSTDGGIKTLSIDNVASWQRAIEQMAVISPVSKLKMREDALACARSFIARSDSGPQSISMFEKAIASYKS